MRYAAGRARREIALAREKLDWAPSSTTSATGPCAIRASPERARRRSAKKPSTSHSRPGTTDARMRMRTRLSPISSISSTHGRRTNDGELLDALRQDAHGRDLGVVDVDDLAVERLQSRAPQRDVLDDALQLVARDEDRVADGVPALGKHREAGDDVGEDALKREADQHEHERRPGDRGEAVDAADQLREGEHAGGHEPGDRDHILDERDERLAPLDRRDLALAELGVVVPPVVPGQNGARDDTARFREQPGGDEQTDDDEDGEHGGSGGNGRSR